MRRHALRHKLLRHKVCARTLTVWSLLADATHTPLRCHLACAEHAPERLAVRAAVPMQLRTHGHHTARTWFTGALWPCRLASAAAAGSWRTSHSFTRPSLLALASSDVTGCQSAKRTSLPWPVGAVGEVRQCMRASCVQCAEA